MPDEVNDARTRPPLPELWALAALVLLFHTLTNRGYGWFRDELYFIACGHHPAFGYVDQPPLFPLLAAAVEWISSGSRVVFRMPAAIAHASLVLLTGVLSRRLGARRFGALVAGAAATISPTFLVGGHLMTMNAFEPLVWLGLAMIAAALIDGADRRLWVAAGALVGVGILLKHSTAFAAACLLVAIALTPARAILRTRWLAVGAGAAALLVLPHALWQVEHGFPMLELLRNGQLHKNAPFSLQGFAVGQLVEENPLNVLVWAPGLWFLLRSRFRALGLSALLLFLLFAAMKAKVYYFAPAFPALFAGGGAQLEAWLRRAPRARWALAPLQLCSAVPPALIALPLLPPERVVAFQQWLHVAPARLETHAVSPLAQHLADELPWDGEVAAVQRAFDQLAPEERQGAILFAQNYGQAAAIDVLGRSRGLPPASSGHNSYYLWGPQGRGPTLLLVDGNLQTDREFCDSLVEGARTPDGPYLLPYERNLPVLICRGLKRPIEELWPRVRLYI